MYTWLKKSSGRNSTAVGETYLLLIGVVCLATVWPASVAAARPAAATGSCVVGEWGPWTPCIRTGLHHWEHSHSRAVQKPAGDCPALTETAVCEASRAPRPSDAATAAQQAVSGLLTNLPLAAAVGLKHPSAAADRISGMTVTPELATSLAAGRALWQQQASRIDKLHCSPFNGPVELLRAAAIPPISGAQAQLAPVDDAAAGRLADARAAFAAIVKSVALSGAAAARNKPQDSSGTSTSPSIVMLDVFRQAVGMPRQSSGEGEENRGVVPGPTADVSAVISWDGSDKMKALVQPGPGMSAAAAHTATEALHDGEVNVVPWLTIQDGPLPPRQPPASLGLHLNMTYNHSQLSATFNSVPTPTGTPSDNGLLLLSIHHHLTGVYGLDLRSSSAKEGLMDLPTTDAVLRTNAGGGVDQLGVTLAGAWTQANLSAALGLNHAKPQQQQQQDQASFTFTDPMLLFSAAPAALYVAVQSNVPSLGVRDAPATINMKPGGAAALELFEPCEPVPGLQLSDVQLHLEPEGNLTGIASGKLASTAVSALATVSPTASASGARGGALSTADQDLSMVMTAETVGAGKLADVITIITRKDPPVQLLQSLQQQQQQQRMQFSSVTLTYQSPKAKRRRSSVRPGLLEEEAPDGGFNMVAVPDIKSAPALQQMLDAIGLNQEALTLRTSSAGGVGSVFGVARDSPYSLQLPAPFTSSGPTLLTLQYGQQTTNHVAPADTLLTTSLAGTSTAGLLLPGVSAPVAVDLSTVAVTTPTAIVGASGQASGQTTTAPVTGQLGGNTVGAMGVWGLPFLQFGTLNVSATAGFQPLALQDLRISGPLTAFGVSGTAEFSANSGPVVQQDGAAAAVDLMAYLPSIDLPLMARALGTNMSLGVLSANLKSVRAQTSSSTVVKAGAQGAKPGQDAGVPGLAVAAELEMIGMRSYVNFDLAAQQQASLAATFVAGQINRVMMPSLLSAVSAALQATNNSVSAAAAASTGSSRQGSLTSLVDDAQEAVKQAKQQLDSATAALSTANQQAVRKVQQAAATAEAASAAYHTARIQSGLALLEARNELNTADTVFNQAKSQAYNDLNAAQQAYKDALKAHEAVVKTAQDRVDYLLSQTLQLRADYNAANMLCNPTPQGLQDCKTAAAAWVQYQSASAALDVAQTALQEAATVGPSAQTLQRAKVRFANQRAVANAVVAGQEWAAHSAAAAKLQAAMAALNDAETGRVAVQMRAANNEFARAQAASRVLLSTAAREYVAVRDAKHALKAARAGLKAATAVGRLTPEDLSAASADLASVLGQLHSQAAAVARLTAQAVPSAAAADVQQVEGLVKFDLINIGVDLRPQSTGVAGVQQSDSPVLMSVSYSGAVVSGDQQKPLMGRFQVDVTDSSSEELGLVLAEVLRDDALNGIRSMYRSLAALL